MDTEPSDPRPTATHAFGRLHYDPQHSRTVVGERLALAGLSLLAVCVIGVFGYWVIGGGEWSVKDCAYMVLITVTTVGYAEVLPVNVTDGGRLFTMGLLVTGMGVSFYFLSALTAFIIEGDLREVLWRRKMAKRLSHMKNHYIVCGAGRTGRQVAAELLRDGCDVVVVERKTEQLSRLSKIHGEIFVGLQGDATEDAVLREAGIERARGLVTTLHLDQDNLFVALSARQLNPELRIVSRANAERAQEKLQRAGADITINPTNIGGRRMAHELLRPNVVGFLDFMARDLEQSLSIEEVPIPKGSPLAGRKLANSKIREESSALVLAIIDPSGSMTYNPLPSVRLEANSTLIVLGERDQIERLQSYLDDA